MRRHPHKAAAGQIWGLERRSIDLLLTLSDGHLHDLCSTLPGMIGDPNLSFGKQMRRVWSYAILLDNRLIEVVDKDWDRITPKGRAALEREGRKLR